MKYSDFFCDSLIELGYTHCFFLSGGNILHLLQSASSRFECIPVINEVSAVIAAEYFNIASRSNKQRAFALVTAGPGLTNAVTGIAGAWLENREVLIVGGQSRSDMLAKNGLKQLGHQEVGGVNLVSSITKFSHSMTAPLGSRSLKEIVAVGESDPKGPVFIEVCLDVSSMDIRRSRLGEIDIPRPEIPSSETAWLTELELALSKSERPLILMGSGVTFDSFSEFLPILVEHQIPIATSWNASDYLDFDSEIFAGRPGAYGMRFSNLIVQQADLILAVGTRFSFWETGFNWDEFAPQSKIWLFNIDPAELNKPGPKIDRRIHCDLKKDFKKIVHQIQKQPIDKWKAWITFIQVVKISLPLSEESNRIFGNFCNPFDVISGLASSLLEDDVVIPCSSGGAYTTVMQGFRQKMGQLLTNNRGLASMGYGLAGAIGSCFAKPGSRVVLVEGDGGFLQNLSELSTVVQNKLNLKILIFANNGYASIKLSQKANFGGHYIGCDPQTGVAIPDLNRIFEVFGLTTFNVQLAPSRDEWDSMLGGDGPIAVIVNIHPDQPYFPKIASRLTKSGEIESNPIHLMSPELPHSIFNSLTPFIKPRNSDKNDG